MNSEAINDGDRDGLEASVWLREIAYQLALMNEEETELWRTKRDLEGSERQNQILRDALDRTEPGKKDAELERDELWPKITPQPMGCALQMHPSAEPKFFDSEEDARAYLREMAQRMNEYVPPKKIEREMYPTPPGRHPYTSTACQHALHDRCRKSCKFCASPCMCSCHTKKAEGLEGFEPPVDPKTVAHPSPEELKPGDTINVGLFPKIAPDGSGRFGVWFGPGPALRSFDTEQLAQEYLQDVIKRMNYWPDLWKESQHSEARPICEPGKHRFNSTPHPAFESRCLDCGRTIEEILQHPQGSEPSSETSSTPHHQVDGLYVHAYRELYEAAKATNDAIKEYVFDGRLRRALEACTKPKTP